MSVGSPALLPGVEQELYEKLTFIQAVPASPGSSQSKATSGYRHPFAEIRLLANIEKQQPFLFKSALALQKMPEWKRKKNAHTMNYCFLGNPDTDKTTVARLFARILNDSGMRHSTSVEMCSAQQLKEDGAKAVREKIDKAMGGVIFIDEACELGEGHFGEEALTTLVAAMTSEVYAGVVIIMAGTLETWTRCWHCAGGSHYISNADLERQYTHYYDEARKTEL